MKLSASVLIILTSLRGRALHTSNYVKKKYYWNTIHLHLAPKTYAY
jgi:hypothetical protein